jgi:hypothetical protein
MKRLQQKPYMEREKTNLIQPRTTLSLLNEERRRHSNLPPLTVIDYNCMDRASLKLKLVLDCLYLRRQLNGWTLVPRDVQEAHVDALWARRRTKLVRLAARLDDFSIPLKTALGLHVVLAKEYNEQALMIEKSIQKISEFKSRKQLRVNTFKEEKPGQPT